MAFEMPCVSHSRLEHRVVSGQYKGPGLRYQPLLWKRVDCISFVLALFEIGLKNHCVNTVVWHRVKPFHPICPLRLELIHPGILGLNPGLPSR